MGFCLFNNVAVAAAYAREVLHLERIAIVDWDVHHGNGTQDIFYADPTVLFISVHKGGGFYPNTGEVDEPGKEGGVGYNINCPFLADGMGDASYIALFREIVVPVLSEFDPELIIVSAGFDSAFGDNMGPMKITPKGFAHLTQFMLDVCPGRVVLALEGGYELKVTARAAEACVRTLLGETPSEYNSELIPHWRAYLDMERVIAVHKDSWNCLSELAISDEWIAIGKKVEEEKNKMITKKEEKRRAALASRPLITSSSAPSSSYQVPVVNKGERDNKEKALRSALTSISSISSSLQTLLTGGTDLSAVYKSGGERIVFGLTQLADEAKAFERDLRRLMDKRRNEDDVEDEEDNDEMDAEEEGEVEKEQKDEEEEEEGEEEESESEEEEEEKNEEEEGEEEDPTKLFKEHMKEKEREKAIIKEKGREIENERKLPIEKEKGEKEEKEKVKMKEQLKKEEKVIEKVMMKEKVKEKEKGKEKERVKEKEKKRHREEDEDASPPSSKRPKTESPSKSPHKPKFHQ